MLEALQYYWARYFDSEGKHVVLSGPELLEDPSCWRRLYEQSELKNAVMEDWKTN